MKGNSTKRIRHAFRPSVDPLEGRVVLSSGVAARAAHLHHLQVQKQHQAELRQEASSPVNTSSCWLPSSHRGPQMPP